MRLSEIGRSVGFRAAVNTVNITGHKRYVKSVVISPDGRRVVSGSWDNTVKVWDIKSGQCLKTLEGHTSHVESVAISPDGRRIVSGGGSLGERNFTVKLWEMESGQCLKTLVGHTDIVCSVAVSPDGRRIVTGSWDNSAKVWEIIYDLEFD